MFQGIRYSKLSGEILCILSADNGDFSGHEDAEAGVLPLALGDLALGDEEYVDDGVRKARTAVALNHTDSTVAPGVPVVLSNLPQPCFLFNSQTMKTQKITSGTFQFVSAKEGDFLLRLAGPHKGEVEIFVSHLEAVKDEMKLKVDADAEAARSRVVTPGSGQAMTYLRKADAAAAFLAGQVLSEAQQQRLDDEAARLGITVQEAAETIAATAAAWELLDASIDNIRLTAKAAIEAATTGEAVKQIYAALAFPV